MQKLTCKIVWNSAFKNLAKINLKNVKQIEILDVLKENLSKGENMGICRIIMEKDQPLSNLKFSKYYEILEIIERNNCEYICMVKVSAPPYFSKFLELMEMEIIWQCPIIMDKDSMIYTVAGSIPNLQRVLNLTKLMGTITRISYGEAEYNNKMLSDLTLKEHEILLLAIKSGYYEYPRKISGTELALKVKTSKSTVIEHLRKAENKIMISAVTKR